MLYSYTRRHTLTDTRARQKLLLCVVHVQTKWQINYLKKIIINILRHQLCSNSKYSIAL